MSEAAKRLLQEALMLPDGERAEIVSELLDSLPRRTTGDERSDEEWIAEVERRARDALAGSAGLLFEEARVRVREHLSRK